MRLRAIGGRLAALAVLSSLLGAACLPSAAQNRIVRSFAMAEGLPNSQITALLKDRAGFLWIGTLEGVSRFDGTVFTNYSAEDGVPLDRIYAIYQAPGGSLYFGGEGGAAVFDGRRFLTLTERSIRGIAGLADGTVFLGGSLGLIALRPGGRSETLLSPEDPRLSGGSVTALYVTQDGTLYIGTDTRGAFTMRGGKIVSVAYDFSREIGVFAEGRDGTLYAGTRAGLAVLRGGSWQAVPSLRRRRIDALAVGEDGVLYLGTYAGGVLRLRASTLETLAPIARQSGLSSDEVHAIHAAPGGPVFFGTDNGLDVFNGDAVATWTRAQGLPDTTVWSLAEDGRGALYAAAAQGGVMVLRNGRWHPLGGRLAAGTTCVHAGSSGRLYVGDFQGRVRIFRAGRLSRIVELPERTWVTAILEGPGDVIYAATRKGLARIHGREIRFLRVSDGLPGTETFSLALAADGTLYLATEGGLAALRDGVVVRVWTRKDGLANDCVLSVRIGRDGSVYLGTLRGLSILREGRITTYRTIHGLTNNVINCILEDSENRLYLSTNRGVNVLDLRASARAAVLPAYGLGQRTGNVGACLRDHRGRLWFGIESAVTVIDPLQDRPRRRPRVLLSRDDLTFSFTGIDLAAHRMRFRYRLEGLDQDWIETDQRSVRYPYLLPGSYGFEVQAVNDAGLWSAPAELPFTILPPPLWRRPALVLGLAAFGIALAGGLYAMARVRQLLEVERLRTAIAADLHDQIGAGLTDIAILSEVAVRKTGGLPELTRVAATARDLVDGLGDIVWLVNPRRDSLYELFLRLKDSYADLFAHAGAQLEVADLSPFEAVRLPMPYRQNLHLLFQEALRNALRHSGCRRAELTVTLDRHRGRRLDVTLRDDGHGFDAEAGSSQGEGLETMRRRAERLGGRLTIESSAEGTAVRFTGSCRWTGQGRVSKTA
jgi:signal transduction histidine kinase/ligand-binding sensor domain-containing protein